MYSNYSHGFTKKIYFIIMQDLTLISKRHQRYEQGMPVMGVQDCGRALIIKESDFCKLMDGVPVEPSAGFIIRMVNTDVRDAKGNYLEMMQPKLMTLVSNTPNKIELKGVVLYLMGTKSADFSNYSITLHLINRKVVKCVLHMLDRGIDIEYLDIHP